MRQRRYPELRVTVACGDQLVHEFPPHRHRSLALGQVLSGSREIAFSDAALPLHPGQVYAILPGEVHSVRPLSPDQQSYQVLCVRLPAYGLPETLAWQHGAETRPAVRDDAEVSARLNRCLAALAPPLPQAEAAPALAALLAYLAENYLAPAANTVSAGMQQVKARLEQDYADPLDLETLEAQAALSKYHLDRRFHEEIGLPPHAYLIQVRIRQAQDMLADGHTVIETAHALGFHDQSHFTRFFKRHVGLTPAHYQRLNHRL